MTLSSETNSVTTILPMLCLLGPGSGLLYSTDGLLNREDEDVAEDQLSTTFAALADPTRRAILARLADGEATVTKLAQPFPISVQAVSKHLRVLEHAGLIERGREAQL